MATDKDVEGSTLQRALDQRYSRTPSCLKSYAFREREAEIIKTLENKTGEQAKVLQDTADKLGVKVETLLNRKRWLK